MTDHRAAGVRRVVEDERGFVAKMPRPSGVIDRHGDDRFDDRRAAPEGRSEQVGETPALARELFRVGEMLPVAAAADPEVPAERGRHESVTSYK